MSQSDNSTVSRLLKDMDAHFGETEGKEAEAGGGESTSTMPRTRLNEGSPVGPISATPTSVSLKLHEYKREPKKRVIAEGKLKEQNGLCARSKSGPGVCGGSWFELDHTNGDPDDWAWENMELLCKTHHTIKTNLDRAKRRSSATVSVKRNAPSADRATWTSKEGQKAEWSRPEFDKWIANPQTWLDLGKKTGMDLKIGEPAYLADLLDFGADSIIDPDYPEGISQETLRRYVNARRFSTLRLEKLGHRRTIRFVGPKIEETVKA